MKSEAKDKTALQRQVSKCNNTNLWYEILVYYNDWLFTEMEVL